MTTNHVAPDPRAAKAPERQPGSQVTTCCTAIGITGGVVCSLSMIAAAVGIFAAGGTAAARGAGSAMAGMGSSSQAAGAPHVPSWLEVVLRFGPEITIVSVLLVSVSVALRRRIAALPAIVGGVILYAGMYAQPSVTWMYGAIVVGIVLLVLASVVATRRIAVRTAGALPASAE